MIRRQGGTVIGMDSIKSRRLALPVTRHPGTNVGDSVPFYFCPRSIMLYVIHCANNLQLAYKRGQNPIIHLEADLKTVVNQVEDNERLWAFSLSNAGAYYTQFHSGLDRLGEINWDAVIATGFWSADIKEGKQAEFLVNPSFPWHLIERIGVHSQEMVSRVSQAMKTSDHRPRIEIMRNWYF
jgi:ssDNA thymidine ADP-ribosyltransferase, DarT